MLTVTKSVKFDAAHVLTNHQGLCKNLHGHTYRVEVSVAQPPESTADMVIDFKDLKQICEETIIARFDHACIYDSTSEGESADERVIAAYADDVCVKAGAADRPVFLVNATGKAGVLAELAAKPAKVEYFNVFGEKTGEANVAAGIVRLAVPASGYG